MGRHDNKSTGNGQGELDISKTKKVEDTDGGRHSDADKGEQGREDDKE